MGWIKDELIFFISRSDKEKKEFEQYNNQLVLGRIRLISLATICLSFMWVYVDYMIVHRVTDRIYGVILVLGHIISVVTSLAVLILYNKLSDMRKSNRYTILNHMIKLYVFLYILVGVVSSINSQRNTGNIYSYIILSLITATALTLKPSYMLFIYGVNHIIFILGTWVLIDDLNLFLVKMLNATAMVGASFLLGFIFYRHRMVEFLCRKELMENEENFKKLFYVNPYPVFIISMKDGRILEANNRACALLDIDTKGQYTSHEIDGFINNDSILALQEELLKHNSTYNRIVEYDFNGKHMWVTANYELIDYHGEKCILTGVMDITEIRKAEEELNHYASTDALTGIMNRRMGMKKLEELLVESGEDEQEFVVLYIDINNLKKVNDTYGHREGDRYILTFCDMIKRCLHEEDIFFRMGGDEFIIIFKNRNKSQAETVWKEMQKQFSEWNRKGESFYQISASHGLAYYHSGMDIDIDHIIEKADKQMYMEKQRFRKEYQTKPRQE